MVKMNCQLTSIKYLKTFPEYEIRVIQFTLYVLYSQLWNLFIWSKSPVPNSFKMIIQLRRDDSKASDVI